VSECPYPELAATTAYTKRGCRCDRCRLGMSEYRSTLYPTRQQRADKKRRQAAWKAANRDRVNAAKRASYAARRGTR
jgi:hypothetical protein